jgi:hypothetical protein
MKDIKLSFFFLYASIAVSAAVSSINCAGAYEANISGQPPILGPTGYEITRIFILFPI